jgi:hypothetical protein
MTLEQAIAASEDSRAFRRRDDGTDLMVSPDRFPCLYASFRCSCGVTAEEWTDTIMTDEERVAKDWQPEPERVWVNGLGETLSR